MRMLSVICGLFFSCVVCAKDFPKPGVDSYQQMIQLLGKPRVVQNTPDNGRNFIYPDVVVYISGHDISTIASISFSHPHIFSAYQGLDVGMTTRQVMARLTDYYVHQSPDEHFITDYQRGLIFWMENGHVVKLVQVKPGTLKRIR